MDINKNGKYDPNVDEFLEGMIYPCKKPKDPLFEFEIIVGPPKEKYISK